MAKKGLWRGCTALSASLFAFLMCGTGVASAYESTINMNLGTTSFRVEKTGEATSDGTYFDSEFASLEDEIAAKEAIAEEIAEEGVVLFKNEGNALPIDKGKEKITIWGMNSLIPTLGGLIGSTVATNGDVGQKSYGIIEAMTERGFELNGAMTGFYGSDACADYMRKAAFFGAEVPGHALVPSFGPMYEDNPGYLVGEVPADKYPDDVLASADDTTAVVFISRDSSEAADYSPTMEPQSGDEFTVPLALSKNERAMIALAKEHSNGKIIVMLNSDMTMEIEELKQDPEIGAILWTGLPGAYGYLGVADILSGEVNPSGHISDSYAVSSTSAPAMVNFGVHLYNGNSTEKNAVLTAENKGDWYLVENEGIYVGYKYYETRYEDSILGQGNATAKDGSLDGAWDYTKEMTYPFGYGLSYTSFEQTLKDVNIQVGGESTATIEVTNTGDVAGKDVVELYVQCPYTEGGLEKSAIQLIDFGKTGLLEPGASETVTLTFDARYFASYDNTVQKADDTQGAWVLEEGDYYFAIGNGAHAALNNVLANKTGSTDGLQTITADEVIHPENAKVVSLQRDDTTYSENVQNALTDADLNQYIPDKVTYFSRADWTKGWDPVTDVTPTEEMMKGLTDTVSELTENGDGVTWGQNSGMRLVDLIEVDDEGKIAGVVDLGDPQWDTLLDQITLKEALEFMEYAGDEFEVINSIGLNNVYLNDGPIGFVNDQVPGYSAKWDKSLSDEATYVGEKDEYADYYLAVLPTEPVVAATFNKDLITREGEMFGEDGLWSNVSGAMGPGMNLHRATYCSRNHEYYSEDSVLTGLCGLAVATGMRNKGEMATPKHFAFNHQESNRSGLSTFLQEQGGRENELRGYEPMMRSNMAGGVMTAFNRIGTVFDGAYRGTNVQILRNEWGFTGWVVSDMINGADYMNWRDNIFGGGGALLAKPATYAEESKINTMLDSKNMAKIEKDTAFQQEIKTALRYYLYTFAGTNAMNGVTSDTRIIPVLPWWKKLLVGVDILLGALAVLSLVMYALSIKRKEA